MMCPKLILFLSIPIRKIARIGNQVADTEHPGIRVSTKNVDLDLDLDVVLDPLFYSRKIHKNYRL